MTIMASCGHVLTEGEELVSVALGGETIDAVDGILPCITYGSYCPACAAEAMRSENYLKDAEAEEQFWKHAN